MEWNWGEQVDSKGEMLSSLEERKICNIQYSNLENLYVLIMLDTLMC